MPQPSPDVASDLAHCRQLLREGSRSFGAAAKLLPAGVRDAATALYAFCRVADDAIDLGDDRPAALAMLRERLDRVYAGTPADAPCDRAFARLVAGSGLPRELPQALLEGFEWDAEGRQYEDLGALHDYAARVAGTVGAMMAWVMGVRDAGALARACDLGVGMQLTNIARDVGEDARAGRLYLPRAWMRDAGIDPDAWLARPVFDAAIASVIGRVLNAAERAYARADAGIAALPKRCRPAIGAARVLYAEIGREVERRGLDSVSQRAVVPGRRKLAVLASMGVRALRPGGVHAAAAQRRRLAMPPIAAVRFLVHAAATRHPVAAPPVPRRRMLRVPNPVAAVEQRVVWMLDLFARLERQDRGVI